MMNTRFVAIALATVAPSPLMAASADWMISESSGPVQVVRAGFSKAAVRGGVVQPGDTVITGPGARAVVVRGQEYLMVAGRSQLRLPAAEQSASITRIFQDFGSVVFLIKKKMTPHFSVNTPYLAAVVKGTTFSVSVTPTGTSVQVIEGAVDVATLDGGAHELLKPGAVAMVAAGDRFRLRVDGDGPSRTVVSPAAPKDGTTPASAPAAPLFVATGSEVGDAEITTVVIEAPVSLAETTDGLVKGMIGGEAPAQLAMATESARSASQIVRAATAAVTATTLTEVADGARSEAQTVAATATAAVTAAGQASQASEQSTAAATNAAAAQATTETASAKAAADANRAAAAARSAEVAATAAAQEQAARQATSAAAASAAREAQRIAEQAGKNASDPAAIEAANNASAVAAGQAREASEQAARADADRLARDAARLDADRDAAKAASDADKAARDAMDASAERAARDAAKAADEAVKDAAQQAAKAAKDAEKAASDAARDAAMQAADAARDAERAARDTSIVAKGNTPDVVKELAKGIGKLDKPVK